MTWTGKLSKLLDDRNLSLISKRLGFSKNRLYLIVREGQCPNAIDAVKICRYLNTTVEAIFGDDAMAELSRIRPATKAEADQAADEALAEAIDEKSGRKKASPRPGAKGPGTSRKTG